MADITCCENKDCGKCLEALEELVRQGKLPPDTLRKLHEALCFACRDCEVNHTPWKLCVLPCMFIDAPSQNPDDIVSVDTPTRLSVVVGFVGPGAAAIVRARLPLSAAWFAESIGPAAEVALGAGNTPVFTAPNVFWYVLDIVIPGGTLEPSVYLFSTMISLAGAADQVSLANAYVAGGFAEFIKP